MSMKHFAAGAVAGEMLSHSKWADWARFFKIAIVGALPMALIGLLTGTTGGMLVLWFFILWPVFGGTVLRRGEQVLAMKAQERMKPGSTDLAYYTPMPKVDRTTAAGEYKWVKWMVSESDTIALLRDTAKVLHADIANPVVQPYIPVLFDMYVEQAGRVGEQHPMWQADIEVLVKTLVDRRQECGA